MLRSTQVPCLTQKSSTPSVHPRGGARTLASFATTALVFLPLPLIGTLVHECGHAGVARLLGCRTQIHFGSTDWATADGRLRSSANELPMHLGGPCMDMLVGTAGLIWLASARAKLPRDAPLGPVGWVAALLALFWSRPVFVALRLLAAPATRLDFQHLDEVRSASALGLPCWVIAAGTGMIGAAVCLLVVLRWPAASTFNITQTQFVNWGS